MKVNIRLLLTIFCAISLQLSALTVTSSSSSSSSASIGGIRASASASAFARATVFGAGNNWWGGFWATGGYGWPGYDGFGWNYYGNMVNPGYGNNFDEMPMQVDRTPGYSDWRLPNTYFNYQKNNLKHYLQSDKNAPDEPSTIPR